ncbi:MAG: hypothetical protein LC745_12170 [Planctomycetia bacterium]|nr:hypothetical protein [Planctomycetia bacterium]
MDEPETTGMFRGSELSRLLILLAIASAGWVAVWFYLVRPRAAPPEPWQVVTGKPAAVEADRSVEFETVTDKKPISLRDMAAYSTLLTRAGTGTPAELAAQARRDVYYAHLWGDPKEYRGVPIHLEGTARRVLYYRSKLSRTGWLYETWMFTPDGQGQPYVCVSEDAPKGYPLGPNLQEGVAFNGYFLKLMRYEAGDVPRAAPLLIGRIVWARPASPVDSTLSTYWPAAVVGLIVLIGMVRWVVWFRRSFAPKPPPSFLRDRPGEEIAPEALSEYFGNPPEDDDDSADDERR